MTRHISDLSWKIDTYRKPPSTRSESISSAPDCNKILIPCSCSMSNLKTNTVACQGCCLGSIPDHLDNSANTLDIPSSDGSESNIRQ